MTRQNLPPGGSFAVAGTVAEQPMHHKLFNNFNCLASRKRVAWRSHREVRIAVMGVMGGSSQDLSGEQRMPSVVYSGRVLGLVCATLVALALSAIPAGATSRIKDLANIEGVRQNQLIGYGLVVGLNGTGDTRDPAL